MTPAIAKEPEVTGLREKLEQVIAAGGTDYLDYIKVMRMKTLAREARALMESEQEGMLCSCEWEHPVDGSIDVRWPAELSTSCPIHGASAVFNADAILGTESENGADDG